MSRLIVKNLPDRITDDKLRQLFSQIGTVTDVQLKYTSSGKFRHFAFVGYQEEKEANGAVEFFNNSHIGSSKITVEVCSGLGEPLKSKAWSKYAVDSTSYKKQHPETVKDNLPDKNEIKKEINNKNKELVEKYKDDQLFEEFMQVHAPNEIKKLISIQSDEAQENDDHEDDDAEEFEKEETGNDPEKLACREISDLDYMKSLVKTSGKNIANTTDIPVEVKSETLKFKLFTVKLHGLPYNCKKKDIKDFFRPVIPYSIRLPPKIKGIAYIGFKTEKSFKQALAKDRSFIAGKRISVALYTDPNAPQSQTESKSVKWKRQEEALQHEEDIVESGRIFLRNLSYTTMENDIESLFSKFGPLTEVNLPLDRTTRKIKGFGIVTFMMPEHAVKAYSELDGTILHGRMLHLLPGKAKDKPDNLEGDTTNYKKKKSLQQKAEASSSHNWNSLFLSHDAVAEVIAQNYNTSKEAVLDPHGDGSAAVRLALGETQIVASTKKYLEQEGVYLDAFSKSTMERSKTVILVKNLPSKTECSEIKKLFESFGVINRIILPPSGITAIVEFIEPTEARKAFTKLAYTKFKSIPLYLEWAPHNLLVPKKNSETIGQSEDVIKIDTNQETASNNQNDKKYNIIIGSGKDNEEDDVEEEVPEPETTIFVKNLNFETTNEDLQKHFDNCGKTYCTTIATKKNPNNSNELLSMGYGFVQFLKKASADKALKTLQYSTLNGKSLELKRSERTLNNTVKTARKQQKATKQTGTKILVRNVPFQAKKKELMELFRAFGEIKALRLPKKMTIGSDSHRGFAFIDYCTSSDAKKAFESLCQSTHLFGRRLVLEWAASEDGVDELRKRTADHFHPVEEVQSKKSVLDIEKI